MTTTTISYSYDYGIGKIASKTITKDEVVVRTESYKYSHKGELVAASYEGSKLPQDQYGHYITSEEYSHDAFNNLTAVKTSFQGGENTATYSYQNNHFAQVSKITNTHPDYVSEIIIQYDELGNVINDGSNEITYDELNRVKSLNGKVVQYDEAGKIIHIAAKELYYEGDSLQNEINEHGEELGYNESGRYKGEEKTIYQKDEKGSNLKDEEEYVYTTYGYRYGSELGGISYHNNYEVDGLQLMGNGYRLYSPSLRRFYSADTLSPGIAGINPYTYNLGDPINRTDPTGHMSIGGIFGIVFGAIGLVVSVATLIACPPAGALAMAGSLALLGLETASLATGIAADTVKDEKTANTLGYISMGLGFISGAAALVTQGPKLCAKGVKLISGTKATTQTEHMAQPAMQAAKINNTSKIKLNNLDDIGDAKSVTTTHHAESGLSNKVRKETINAHKNSEQPRNENFNKEVKIEHEQLVRADNAKKTAFESRKARDIAFLKQKISLTETELRNAENKLAQAERLAAISNKNNPRQPRLQQDVIQLRSKLDKLQSELQRLSL